MEFEKKFVRNYLSTTHFKGGKFVALLSLVLCLILSQFYWDQTSAISSLLAGNGENVFIKGEYWRLLTSLFIHGDIKHLLSNSLMLYFLMYFVASSYGKLTAMSLFAFGGSLINAVCLSLYDSTTFLVGASGVVYLLWGFWFAVYLFVETQRPFLHRVIRVMGIFLILLVPTSYDPATSYLAHYSGFAIGAILGGIYYLLKSKHLLSFEIWDYHTVPMDEEPEIIQPEDVINTEVNYHQTDK